MKAIIKTMKKKVFLLTLVSAISVYNLFGQDVTVGGLSSNSQLPPSGLMDNTVTNAANLSQVDMFTGRPSISIPIFKRKYGTVSFDLSIGYNSQGIQYGQQASEIGLGWDLSSGFSLTRIVRGNADDELDGGNLYRMDYTGTALKPADCRQRVKGFWRNANSVPLDEQSSGGTVKAYFLSNEDSEQDIFSLALNGESVKFVIGKNGEIFTLSPNDWKIEYSYNTTYIELNAPGTLVDKFTVTDNNGNKYYFKAMSYSRSVGISGCDPFTACPITQYINYGERIAISKWEIDEIITYNGETIKFNYSNSYPNSPSLIKDISYSNTPFIASKLQNGGDCYRSYETAYFENTYNSVFGSNFQLITYNYKPYLQSILLPDGLSIDFSYGTPRKDAECNQDPALGWKSLPLKQISLKKNGYLNFEYNLHQSYFDHSQGSGSIPYNTSIYNTFNAYDATNSWNWRWFSHLRLKLDSITVFPQQYNNSIKYAFTYNTESKMSYRTAFGYDHWGFNNGVNQNSGTLPVGYIPSGTPTDNGNAYREADPVKVSAYILKDITFADNSSIGYLFEANRGRIFDFYSGLSSTVTTGGGLRIKQIKIFDGIDHAKDKITKYEYKNINNSESGILFTKPIYEKDFECMDHGFTKLKSGFSLVNAWGFTKDGAYCGYSRVSVIYGNNGEGGKDVYSFSNLVDGTDININPGILPSAPFCNAQYLQDWKIGLMKKREIFNSNNNLVAEELYEYSTGEESPSASSLPFFKGVKYDIKKGYPRGIANDNCNMAIPWDFYKKVYYPIRGYSHLTKKISKEYTGSGAIVRTTDFSYDSKHNRKTELVIGSDGKHYETRYYRVYDYVANSNNVGFQNLLYANRKKEIIRTDQLLKDNATAPYKYISSSINQYENILIDPSNGIYRVEPVRTHSLNINQPVLESTIGGFSSSQSIPSSNYYYSDYIRSFNSLGLMTGEDRSGHANAILYDGTNIIAESKNAKETEIAYSSFENNKDAQGGWFLETLYITSSAGYSGSKSAMSNRAAILLQKPLNPAKTYKITMWVKAGVPVLQFNTGSPLTLVSTGESTENGWTLYSGTFTGKTSCYIASGSQVDEVRLYPVGATMKTYTHDPFYGKLSECDEQQNVINNVYDFIGRLIEIVNKDGKIVKQYRYGQGIQN